MVYSWVISAYMRWKGTAGWQGMGAFGAFGGWSGFLFSFFIIQSVYPFYGIFFFPVYTENYLIGAMVILFEPTLTYSALMVSNLCRVYIVRHSVFGCCRSR